MIEGLSAPVIVQLDDAGVVHIDCQTNLDCFAAQGYFHAEHRFFQMDLIRRQIRGELAEVIGTTGLSSDRSFRQLMSTREGEPLEEAYLAKLSPETVEILEAYANGVNAWLGDMRAGENGATLTEEYEFPIVNSDNIRDWEAEDSVALYLQLAYQLSESSDSDLRRGEAYAALDPDVSRDLFGLQTPIDSTIFGASGSSPSTSIELPGAMPTADELRQARSFLNPATGVIEQARERYADNPSMAFGPRSSFDGSNNWVVSPSITADGSALLANDPHLSLTNPAIWHIVELDSKTNGEGDLHAAGAGIPAVPGVIIGQNENIAWGVTTAVYDLADAYVEELNEAGDAVIFNGQEVPFIEKEFTFEVSGGDPVTETFEWVPHHGPVISKDVAAGTAVTLRWVAQDAGNDIDFLFELMRADTTQAAADSLGPVRTINQNWVIIDTNGDIAWAPQAAIPLRPWASMELAHWLPLPGDGSAEWQGYATAENVPSLFNPPAGFIATANNDFDGSLADGNPTNDGHTPWQSGVAPGYRHGRIVELLEDQSGSHSADTMLDIQADVYSLHGSRLLSEVITTANENREQLSTEAAAVLATLENWNYECPDGLQADQPDATEVDDQSVVDASVGCSAFHVLMPNLSEAVFADELASASSFGARQNWRSLQSPLARLFVAPDSLINGTAYFDDVSTDAGVETRADAVVAALEATATELDELFESSTSDDWLWGRIHTVTLSSLFSSAGITLFDEGPFANDGGYVTVDVANPRGRDGDYSHSSGASTRVVFEATDEGIRGNFQLPGGQDLHRDSPFYNSLMDEWLSNTPTELLFERDAVDAAAVETIELQPTAP